MNNVSERCGMYSNEQSDHNKKARRKKKVAKNKQEEIMVKISKIYRQI